MKVSDVNSILKDKTMQDKETNFKVKDSKSSGKSKNITLESLANRLDAFYNQFLEFSKLILDFKDYVIKRFDNLVKKNNLIE